MGEAQQGNILPHLFNCMSCITAHACSVWVQRRVPASLPACMQIRRMVYGGSFIDLLEELAARPQLLEIRRAQGLCKVESDQELVLRFFALHRYQQSYTGAPWGPGFAKHS